MSQPTASEKTLELEPQAESTVRAIDVKKHFPVKEGLLGGKTGEVRAVDGVSFSIPKGETFGLVGESGSGKTTLGKTLLHLHEPTGGTVEVAGQRLDELSKRQLREFRQHMQIVFQDPTSSLNPRKRVHQIITEPMRIHDIGTEDERLERAEELLEIVGLPEEYLYRSPTALSGGQKQRVGIARAVAVNPDFVVLDEPTSALDVSVQARIVNLFEDLQERFDLTYLFITHDLSLVKNIADWIGVMYLGRLVEVGPTQQVFRDPQHPYTRALLSAIPTINEADERFKPEKIVLEGEVPDPREKPSGCAFRSRCPHEFPACAESEPGFYDVGPSHYSRCFLHDDELEPDGPPWEPTSTI
ncbi:ABC transporter ATP-binding protein [Halorussus sp. AFM4]|uniref:ABC transporter ATP-binding protein n=1 Tax=Halorussus sp. AFM4 TaxID=3421651 RepID=UPI003EB78639